VQAATVFGRVMLTVCAVGILAAAAMADGRIPAADRKEHEKLSNLVGAVIKHGPDSRLPAHLSMVLGLSATEREIPVKQAVMRSGDVVRTFNVCDENHRDVVLIAYNERSRVSKAYLVSPAGRLRKAVSFQAGEAAVHRSPSEARGDAGSEVEFWAGLAHVPPPALSPSPSSRP
jgi:hypothetical protein